MTEKMSLIFSKYITALDHAGSTLLFLLGASSGVSLCSFTTIINTHIGIVITSISIVFFVSNAIVKMFLKTTGRKKYKKENSYYNI